MEQSAIDGFQASVERGRVALLVDGDNIAVDFAGHLLIRASGLGRVIIKRVYLDLHHFRNWESAAGFSLTAVRGGRDAADKHLLIDAVDLFHRGDLGAVVIASTDGGYAPLGRFLVERGVTVLGIGGKETPLDWRKSCTRFEVLPERKVVRPVEPEMPQRDRDTQQTPQTFDHSNSCDASPSFIEMAGHASSERTGRVLDAVDGMIRDLIHTNGTENAISIGVLGQLLHKHDTNALTKLGVPRWRQYLQTRSQLYQLEPPSATARVRWIGG